MRQRQSTGITSSNSVEDGSTNNDVTSTNGANITHSSSDDDVKGNTDTQNNPTGGGSGNGGLFECNICFDTPQDPVVTRCGHLYCWSCLWRWMRQRSGSSQCPVCKASVTRDTVTPIYGRGRAQGDDPRERARNSPAPPPRPSGQRIPNAAGQGNQNGGGNGHPAGIHPYWHPAAAFGRGAYAAGGAHGNLALATFGNFPSLFGMEFAYPQFNEQANETPRLTPEQETREQVAKVFLFLALFIIVIITLF